MVEKLKNNKSSAVDADIPHSAFSGSTQHIKNQFSPSGLAYFLIGNFQKPTILFLHGFMGSALDWLAIAQALSEDFCCLLIDLPGHGQSLNVAKQNYSMRECAALVIELLDKLQIDKTNLVGYSMGGRLGFYLTGHFPDRLRKIVLESASPGLQSESEQKERRLHDAKLADKLISMGMEAFLEFWYDLPLFATLKSHSDLEKLKAHRKDNSPEKLAMSLARMGTGNMPNLWPKLRNIPNPVLLITGARDDKFCRLNALVQSQIPNSQHKIIQQCGHNVHFEKSKIYTEIIQNFFTDGGNL